jgi:hypothetical protein
MPEIERNCILIAFLLKMLQQALTPQLTAGSASELQQNGVSSLHFEDSLQLAAGSFNSGF